MTDKILEMAHKAKLPECLITHPKSLARFAAIVAADKEQRMIADGWRRCAIGQRSTQFCNQLEKAVQSERDACADICDHQMDNAINLGMKVAAGNCADAIRARGQQ